LLAAAMASCLEHGYEGASVSDIARRAGVTTPAIYNYFASKDQLMVTAGREVLARLRPASGTNPTPSDIIQGFLADNFADSRRLIIELHVAGQRHPEVAELLKVWHAERAEVYRQQVAGPDGEAAIATFFALLLGLCLVESLATMAVANTDVANHAARLAQTLFPSKGNTRPDA
jgi:AcrR family transcriptional regulator